MFRHVSRLLCWCRVDGENTSLFDTGASAAVPGCSEVPLAAASPIASAAHGEHRESRKENSMAIRVALLPEGTRVRIRRSSLPQDAALLDRTGTVVIATEYRDNAVGVVLDGEQATRWFTAGELEVIQEVALPPERESAKRRPALP
jgi:hypothetical protein